MPRDSRRVRQLRRLKRERTNALRMLDHVLIERNTYRQILQEAQRRYVEKIVEDSKANVAAHEGEVVPENRVVEVPGADDLGIHGAND